jgi:hypothetical protein
VKIVVKWFLNLKTLSDRKGPKPVLKIGVLRKMFGPKAERKERVLENTAQGGALRLVLIRWCLDEQLKGDKMRGEGIYKQIHIEL